MATVRLANLSKKSPNRRSLHVTQYAFSNAADEGRWVSVDIYVDLTDDELRALAADCAAAVADLDKAAQAQPQEAA